MKSYNCPISFDLEITARCSNDCRHCYICKSPDDSSARAKELSVDEIMQIADKAVSMGVLWCNITGGEPLLREDFRGLYRPQKDGLLVSLFTNACLIREEHIELFKKYPPETLRLAFTASRRDLRERESPSWLLLRLSAWAQPAAEKRHSGSPQSHGASIQCP